MALASASALEVRTRAGAETSTQLGGVVTTEVAAEITATAKQQYELAQTKAEQGDVNAQISLGMMHNQVKGVKKSWNG